MDAIELGALADAVGVCLEGDLRARLLTGVSTDTRTLRVGDVFFALSGERFDGAALVEQAFAQGARAVVGPLHSPDCGPRRTLLRVPCVRQALVDFGAWYRGTLRAQVVAITGSAGKTTTKELLAAMLLGSRSVVRAPKSFNNEVGVPLTLLQADRATDVVVLEIGTSGPGEIARLAAVARPDVAILTLIAPAHLAGLGSVEGVAREKLALAAAAQGLVILNGDDSRLRAWAEGRSDVVRCGFGAANDVRGSLGVGARPRLRVEGTLGGALQMPLPGRGPALDALLALAAADALGVTPSEAAEGLRGFRGPQGRMHTIELARHTLLDDTYNANPASMRASLGALCELEQPDRAAAVLGDMLELGAHSEGLHAELGRFVAAQGLGLLVSVGPLAREVARAAREAGMPSERVLDVDDADAVLSALLPHLNSIRTALFKGSRGARLERAVAQLRQHLTPARGAA